MNIFGYFHNIKLSASLESKIQRIIAFPPTKKCADFKRTNSGTQLEQQLPIIAYALVVFQIV